MAFVDALFDIILKLKPEAAVSKLEREGFRNLKPDFTDLTRVMARDDTGVVFKVQLAPQPLYGQFATHLCHEKCTALTYPNLPQILNHDGRYTMLERLVPVLDTHAADIWNDNLFQLMHAYKKHTHPQSDINEGFDLRHAFIRNIIRQNPKLLKTAALLVNFTGKPNMIRFDDIMCRQDGTHVVLEPSF
ncbi:MAG: hypothetical protein WAZ18_00540 [Alphaproteobacteria bacterium]